MGRLQIGETRPMATRLEPRCLSRAEAAGYLRISVRQVDRLIQAGQVSVVRLPVETNRVTGRGQEGVSRRILLDVRDLDRLIELSKERQ